MSTPHLPSPRRLLAAALLLVPLLVPAQAQIQIQAQVQIQVQEQAPAQVQVQAQRQTQAREPYRILIDKVFSRPDGKTLSNDDYARLKAMGFNVISPRWSTPDNGLIPRDLDLCRQHGLAFLPWLRGTFPNEDDAGADYRLTNAGGQSSPLLSPNCDVFWDKLEQHLLQAAAIPAPNLGIFLDFEHYAAPKVMYPYDLSFDPESLARFTAATGKQAAADHPAFREWTYALWQRRGRELAAKVKAVRPDFQTFIYPMISTPFLTEFSRALTETGIPVYAAGATTYERQTFLSLDGAREHVAALVKNGAETAAKLAPGTQFLAGLDPAVKGSTPELFDLTMRLAAAGGAGYWIFFEGVPLDSPLLDAYCEAFTRANQAIRRNNSAPNNITLDDVPPETTVQPPPAFTRPDAKKVFVSGQRRFAISKFLNTAMPEQFEAIDMSGAALGEIEPFDVLILQNLKLTAPDQAKTAATLRDFVHRGGAILLCYGSVLEPAALFPEIAMPPPQRPDTLAVRQNGRLRRIQTTLPLSLPSPQFNAFYPYYFHVTPGPQGQVVATDADAKAVTVAGTFGKGKVIFSGDYFGRREGDPDADEKAFFIALLTWLTTQ